VLTRTSLNEAGLTPYLVEIYTDLGQIYSFIKKWRLFFTILLQLILIFLDTLCLLSHTAE
jgi:hypothetical protein